MGSKPSKAKRRTPVKTKAGIAPRIPQEIIDEILDHLAADSDHRSLSSCALVSKPWVPLCRRRLFHTVLFTMRDMTKWLETFPVPEQSPAHYIRDLRVSIGGFNCSPEMFFEYTPWFSNVERVTFLGDGRWIPTFWRLPESVTSLTINTDIATFAQIQGIMMHLPNLDDLSLSGSLVAVDRRTLAGIGAALSGRFGGRLRLLKELADKDTMNMQLEVPTGIHFTEVEVRRTSECLLPTVRLAEACAKTLVKLSYTVSFYCKSPFHLVQLFLVRETLILTSPPDIGDYEVFERSFDFSEFPNLQEVEFGVCWQRGGLPWIPVALSTLRPETSPLLSAIRLDFTRASPGGRLGILVEHLFKAMGDDLRLIADEIARIGREFGGEVNPTVLGDASFKVALDTLSVRFL